MTSKPASVRCLPVTPVPGVGRVGGIRPQQAPARKRSRTPLRAAQRGVALIVALVLLVVITLVGFAAVRGTIMQQKMATNMYDREIAFQSTEAALRIAADRLLTNPEDIARNCQAGGVICPGNPFDDVNLPAGSIHDVAVASSSGGYTAATISTGQPQYVVESMGNWYDASTDTGFNQSANAHNYGSNGGSQTAVYYRITARSGDPDKVKDRAVVTLQATVKNG